jgi:hypothetical protein
MLYHLFGRLNYISFILIFCFSNLLEQQDAQILQVCLDALHNILKQTGEENLEAVVTQIEECGGRIFKFLCFFKFFNCEFRS